MLLAAGVADEKQRIVLVSADTDARSAALAQADIQAALGRVRVLMARAVLLDLGRVAEVVTGATGLSYVSGELVSDFPEDEQRRQELVQPYIEQLRPVIEQWIRNAQGVKGFNFGYGLAQAIEQLKSLRLVTEGDDEGPPRLDLSGLLNQRAIRDDQEVGICPIPLHDFSGDEMEIVNSGRDAAAISEILRERQVLQYFYPAADQLALGLIDRETVSASELLDQLCAVPELGHPFGPNELTGVTPVELVELVQHLQELKLAAEGELGIELTPEGQSIRASVKFKPRDGLVARVLNHLNINVNLPGG